MRFQSSPLYLFLNILCAILHLYAAKCPPCWNNAAHPDLQRIIEQSIRRIRAAGKAAGFLAVDPKMAQKSLEWGANFVAVGVDTQLYTDALDSRLAMFRPGARREEEKGSY